MGKEDVVHIYNGILLSHKKKQSGSFAEMWMDLESVIQGEVGKRKKHHILRHMCKIQKTGTDEPIFRARKETQKQRKQSTCREAGGRTNWETRIEVYALPFIKQIAGRKLLYRAGNSAWCSVMTQGPGVGGGGIEVQGREDLWIHIDDALCCTAETNMTSQSNYIVAVVQSLGHVQLFVTPQTATHQSPLFMGSPRQEYWSGLLFPSPKDLPDPGIKPLSPALHANSLFLS